MHIFVSHSSRNDPRSAEVRDSVRQRLTSRNHRVDVDVDALRPGEEWRSVLYHWLAECDAAIVLVNEDALASDWVRREVSILAWRRLLGSPLHIFPVLIGVTARELASSELDELSPFQVVHCEPGDDPEAVADKLVSEFATLPPTAPRHDPMSRWIERVARCLDKVDRGRWEELANAARELLVSEEDLGQVHTAGGGRFLAQQLLDRSHDGRLLRAVAEIGPWMDIEPLDRLVTEVASTWVDGGAARGILPRADQPENRVIVLNARDPRTAEHYIARATCRAVIGYSHATAGGLAIGEGGVDELVVEYEAAVRKLLGLESWSLDGVEAGDWTYYLVVTPPRRSDLAVAAIRQLQARCPWLVVILLTGGEIRDGLLDEGAVLRPALEPDDERAALMMTHQLLTLPKRLCPS